MVYICPEVNIHLICRIQERLKHVLRQYEVREKHFECVVRSKELEMLVARARLEELRRLTEEEVRAKFSQLTFA